MLSISGRIDPATIPDAILSPRAAYELDFDDANKEVIFDFRDSTFIVTAVAADCSRLSASAFQTLRAIKEEASSRPTLPWSLIKLYYAAFYSGQTIIRLVGDACSFLDSRHVSQIDAVGKVFGKIPGFRIDAGLYHCALDGPATKMICYRLDRGTHESFWSVFGGTMKSVTTKILSGPLLQSDAQAVFAQLTALDRLIFKRGSYSWLSTLRNDLQYRHGYEVWFPMGLDKADRRMIGRLAAQWKTDPMKIDLDATRFGALGEFVVACAFIVAVCRTMVLRIAERSPQKRSFLNLGPIALLNDAGIA